MAIRAPDGAKKGSTQGLMWLIVLETLPQDGGCATAERLSGRKAHCLPGMVEEDEEN